MTEGTAEEMVEANEEEAFGKWLAGLNTEEEEETEGVEEEVDDPVVIAKTTERKVEAFITEQKVEDLVDKFMAKAPEDAKKLFTIWRKGDEDPKQLKAMMELANVKAQETAAAAAPDIEEEAEKKAAQIAAEQYGVGPISGGQAAAPLTPEQQKYNEDYQKVATQGDSRALLGLLSEDSEFVSAVLTGGEVRRGQK